MDISVHCDVSNFEWLMLWVRRDHAHPTSWPQLGEFQCFIFSAFSLF
jgi:hypothetical protein